MESKVKDILTTVLDLKDGEAGEQIKQSDFTNWDSMKHLILISAFEDEFSIRFADEDVVNMTDYQTIITTIRKYSND